MLRKINLVWRLLSSSPFLPYLDFLDRLSSTYCTEGLTGLSLRWIQPSQQHGRRIPSLSSVIVLLTCSFLVSSFLTKVTQQIHSLRASGVRSSHIASAALSEVRAFRKSMGNLCTTPAEIVLLISWFYQTGGFRRRGWVDDSSWCISLNYISFISWLCIILQSFSFLKFPSPCLISLLILTFSTGCYIVRTILPLFPLLQIIHISNLEDV